MSAGLRSLLSGILDYAGLFPPAQLPFDEAVRNYARYRQSPEAWMLGRFICPATRLQELTPFRQSLSAPGAPLRLSVLGRGGGDIRPFLEGLRDDLEAILAFHHDWRQDAAVDGLELKVPALLCDPRQQQDLHAVTHGPLSLLREAQMSVPSVVFEVDAGTGWLDRFLVLAHSLVDAPERHLGYKLRCGGVQAAAFPPVHDIAVAIVSCRVLQLPMKFTAGLHHPIRHFDAGAQTHMHGFLNVFTAGVLSHARTLGREQVEAIIADEDASHFTVDDAGLRWRDLQATPDEILLARSEAVMSFGSCSFDEPRDDLRTLGLLR